MSDIQTKLTAIITNKLGVDEVLVTPSAHFQGDLGADSLDKVELVMELEDVFGIVIPDEDIERLHTVGEVLHYLADTIPSGKHA